VYGSAANLPSGTRARQSKDARHGSFQSPMPPRPERRGTRSRQEPSCLLPSLVDGSHRFRNCSPNVTESPRVRKIASQERSLRGWTAARDSRFPRSQTVESPAGWGSFRSLLLPRAPCPSHLRHLNLPDSWRQALNFSERRLYDRGSPCGQPMLFRSSSSGRAVASESERPSESAEESRPEYWPPAASAAREPAAAPESSPAAAQAVEARTCCPGYGQRRPP